MEQTKDFPISLDSVLEEARQKNEAISASLQDADEQLMEVFEDFGRHQKEILDNATRHIGDSTNALILCTKKAVQEADETLTHRLLDYYTMMDEGAGL